LFKEDKSNRCSSLLVSKHKVWRSPSLLSLLLQALQGCAQVAAPLPAGQTETCLCRIDSDLVAFALCAAIFVLQQTIHQRNASEVVLDELQLLCEPPYSN
jgi:hypothetical protein